jgi:hypothetical protein
LQEATNDRGFTSPKKTRNNSHRYFMRNHVSNLFKKFLPPMQQNVAANQSCYFITSGKPAATK